MPEREADRWVVGAVLIHDGQLHYTHLVLSSIVPTSIPKETFTGQLDLLACPVALATWPNILRSAAVTHFVDNDSAAAGLARGFSPKRDCCAIIGDY